jgi:O-antigen/teichoic acid export membrane protein
MPKHFHRKRRVIIRGFSWNLAGQVVPAVISIVLTPFLLHHLGLPRYSLLAIAQTSIVFLTSFDGGFGSTAGRYFATHASRGDRAALTRLFLTLVLIMVLIGCLVTGLLFPLANTAVALFDVPRTLYPQALFLARILGPVVTAALVQSVLAALVQAHHRYPLGCAAGVSSALAWAGGAVWVIGTGAGLRGLGLALLAQQLVAILILAPAAASHLRFRQIRLLSLVELRDVAGFSLRRQLFGITTLVNNQFDVFIVAAVLPLGLVGLYATGANFAMQVRGVLSNALVPMGNDITYAYGRDGQEAADRRFVELQKTWVVAVTGFFAVALGSSYWGISVWLGPRYSLAGVVATLMLAGHAVNMYSGPLTLFLNAIGKPGAEARYGIIAMVLNVFLTVPLVLLAGVYGVVAGTVLGMVIGTLILVPLARSGAGLSIPHFMRAVPLVPGLAVAAVSFLGLWLAHGMLPRGPLGLLGSGAISLPPLAVFAICKVGPRRVFGSVRSSRTRTLSHT